MMPRRVIVITSYVPAYRVPLFDALAARLASLGTTLVVAEGRPEPRMSHRADARHGHWSVVLPSRWWRFGSKLIGWRSIRCLDLTSEDLVITQQEVKHLDTYTLVFRRRTKRPRIALWGHGRTYSLPHSSVREWLKRRLTRRGDWLFTYTEDGARFAADGGFPADRITVLRNTIDTKSLRDHLASVRGDECSEIRGALGVSPGHTGLFLGGLDSAKGIEFLLASAIAIRERIPNFVLLIAGDGEDMEYVRSVAGDAGPIRVLGRLEGREKARILSVADVMLIPQWIGLVAVDSLVAGVPIVSTHHPSHSPEREYLVDGVTALFTEATVDHYVEGIVQLMSDPQELRRMKDSCLDASEAFSISDMADSFVRGIEVMASERFTR